MHAEVARAMWPDGRRNTISRRGRCMNLGTVLVLPLLMDEMECLINPLLRPVVLLEVGSLECWVEH